MSQVGWRGSALAILCALLAGCSAGAPAAPTPRPAAAPTAATPASLVAAAPATSAPAATAAPARAITPLSPPLTVSLGGSVAEMPYATAVAVERGYFREVGIDIDFKGRVGDSAAAMTAAASNNLDIAYAATGPALFNSAARGIELTAVAGLLEVFPGDKSLCWLARRDLYASGQVRTPGDFKGLKVAGQAQGVGSSNDVYLERTLAPYGLTYADVEEVNMEFGQINQAMTNRAIDIGWQTEPLMTIGLEQGLYDKIACTGDVYPGYQITLLFYSPQFVANTAAARNFLYAHLRGARDYVDGIFRDRDRAGIIDILVKQTAVKDPAVWNKIERRWISPSGRINMEILNSDQDFYIRRGFLTQRVDVSRLVDRSFADFANTALGEYTYQP